ncbi:MAG: hypothetical protein KJ623_00475 [Nanoarchaeota archaeon]|nr:hypothetical protein [Nanoarchaeota archaeon]MBU0962376.1 hypothetical protein [Nanoarchaeota archaeon]
MKREVDDRTILDKFVVDFVKIIDKFTKYIVVSGFVAIAHGRARGTEDIDIIIERMDKPEFILLHKQLDKNNFECIQSNNPNVIFDDYLNSNLSVRYTRKNNPIPEIELKFAKDSLDNYQLKTRKKFPLTGLDLYFSSIEMNIAFKEELLKSQKDMEDAKHLRIVYSNNLDEDEINKIKKEIRRLRLK